MILALAVILVVVIISLIKTPHVSNVLKNHAEDIRLASTVVTLIGSVTILVAVNTYYQKQRTERENKSILFSNMDDEIEYDLGLVKLFDEQKNDFKDDKKDSMSIREFTFLCLSQSRNLIKDKRTRQIVFMVVADMDMSNGFSRALLIRSPKNGFNSPDDRAGYHKAKVENIDAILALHRRIDKRLSELRTIRNQVKDKL